MIHFSTIREDLKEIADVLASRLEMNLFMLKSKKVVYLAHLLQKWLLAFHS